METNYYNQPTTTKGIHQKTFVWKPSDIETIGNRTMDAFCENHHILSILFNVCDGRLVYVMLFKV